MTRAALLAAPQRTVLVDVALTPPAADAVEVAIAGSGVCGSNLPVWEGRPWFGYPLEPGAPGHEAWGWRTDTGRRVAVLHDAAFAERVVAAVDDVVELPDGLPDGPFPGEALACAWLAAGRARVGAGDRVAVVGCGFLGCVVVALAAAAGAQVTGVSRRASARDAARAMGAAATSSLDDDLDGDFDVVVEAAGVQRTLDVASALVREEGRLVIAGFHQDGTRTVDLCAWNWRGIELVNAHERDRAVVRAAVADVAAAIAAGVLDPRPLYSLSVPLDAVDRAMQAMVDRPDGFVKALVRT